jgi:dGTPase
VHDLEDGVHAGHVDATVLQDGDVRRELAALARETYSTADPAVLERAAERLASLPFWPERFDGSVRSLVALKRMTSELIARLTSAALSATQEAHGPGPLTRYAADLVVPAESRAECAILKAVADRYVMRREDSRRRQARQREQLTELASALLAAAPGSLEPWLHDAWKSAADDAGRLRVVVDQVASLTDLSALDAWQRWCG